MRVTLQQAVDHLLLPIVLDSVPPDPRQVDLALKLEAAEAIILDYLALPSADPANDPPEDDRIMQAAILLQLAELWRFRGDDIEGEGAVRDDLGHLSPTITNLLRRYRDPALA
jgi:hypothetical protein